jgi:hypothetical protein
MRLQRKIDRLQKQPQRIEINTPSLATPEFEKYPEAKILRKSYRCALECTKQPNHRVGEPEHF